MDCLAQNPDEGQAWYLLSFTESTRRGKINLVRHALRVDPTFSAAETRLAELQAAPSPEPVPQARKPASPAPISESKPPKAPNAFWGLARYVLQRGLVILVTIVIGIYLTVLITNKGGQIDSRDKIPPVGRGVREDAHGAERGNAPQPRGASARARFPSFFAKPYPK